MVALSRPMVALSQRAKRLAAQQVSDPNQRLGWNKPKCAGSAWQARRCQVLGRRTRAGRLYSVVTATEARLAAFARSRYAGSRRVFVQETGLRNGAFGADKFGLKNLKEVRWNLGAPKLYQFSLSAGEAVLSADGALCADTGDFTGRSPKDKFTVRDATTEKMWWA